MANATISAFRTISVRRKNLGLQRAVDLASNTNPVLFCLKGHTQKNRKTQNTRTAGSVMRQAARGDRQATLGSGFHARGDW